MSAATTIIDVASYLCALRRECVGTATLACPAERSSAQILGRAWFLSCRSRNQTSTASAAEVQPLSVVKGR